MEELFKFNLDKIRKHNTFEEIDWSCIYSDWGRIIEKFGINLQNLFVDIEINDESSYGREPELSWWIKSNLAQSKKKLLDHLNNCHRLRFEPIHPCQLNKGELETLTHLWEVRDNQERVAALLICTSLFSRMKSSRGHYPINNWPTYSAAEKIYECAGKKLNSEDFPYYMDKLCTSLIPVNGRDDEYTFFDAHAFIRYLAEEHCSLLCKYQPVRIVFPKG